MKIQVMAGSFLLLCASMLFLTGCGQSSVGAHAYYYEDVRFERNKAGYYHGGGRYYRSGRHYYRPGGSYYRYGGTYHRSYRPVYY